MEIINQSDFFSINTSLILNICLQLYIETIKLSTIILLFFIIFIVIGSIIGATILVIMRISKEIYLVGTNYMKKHYIKKR